MPISSLETITLTYLVYSQSPMHLQPQDVQRLYKDWVRRHTCGILEAALQANSSFRLELGRPEDYPRIRGCTCSARCIEIAKAARKATQVCLVEQEYRPGWPHIGYWSVLGAASAIAEDVDGFMVEFGGELPINPYTKRSDGTLWAAEHVLLMTSMDERTRKGRTTTRGLAALGLPELELIDVPLRYLDEIAGLLHPLADLLLRRPPGPIPETLDFRTCCSKGSTPIRLVPGPTHVAVRPPAGSDYKSLKRWYEQMLVDLHAS